MKDWLAWISVTAAVFTASPLSLSGSAQAEHLSLTVRAIAAQALKPGPRPAGAPAVRRLGKDIVCLAEPFSMTQSTIADRYVPVASVDALPTAVPAAKPLATSFFEFIGLDDASDDGQAARKSIAPASAAKNGVGASKSGAGQRGGPKSKAEDAICSANVVGIDLSEFLRSLSEQSGANLLLLPGADQKVTLRLSGVKMLDMLRHVCALTGMKYLKVGDAYVVSTSEKLKSGYPNEYEEAYPTPKPEKIEEKEPVKPITRLITLSNITAEKAAEVLNKAFGNDKLTIIAGPQYMSPSLNPREASNATGVSGTATERSNSAGASKSLVLVGLPEVVELANDILERIDQARRQVVIQVSIHDITNDALKDLGVGPWSFSDINLSEGDPKGINFGSFVRAPQSIAAQLKSLEKTTAAKLLAEPSLSVLDGESAFILIGDKINYPVLVGYTQNNAPIFSKETEKVGIYLQLSCQVSEDGTITLAIYPQVSTITGYLEVNGASYPQIATREAQTTLRFKSGETVVMGGLLKDEDIKSVERVPILSKIPILGEIFTHRKTTKASSQVIITITPTILPPQD